MCDSISSCTRGLLRAYTQTGRDRDIILSEGKSTPSPEILKRRSDSQIRFSVRLGKDGNFLGGLASHEAGPHGGRLVEGDAAQRRRGVLFHLRLVRVTPCANATGMKGFASGFCFLQFCIIWVLSTRSFHWVRLSPLSGDFHNPLDSGPLDNRSPQNRVFSLLDSLKAIRGKPLCKAAMFATECCWKGNVVRILFII